jgi:hypothetical protein
MTAHGSFGELRGFQQGMWGGGAEECTRYDPGFFLAGNDGLRQIRPDLSETFWRPGSNTALIGRTGMLLEILNLILGIVFGFFHRGNEDYTGILRNGAIAGLILGIIFVLIAMYLPGGMSINVGFLGVFGIFIEIIIFVIIFILGAFIGDRIESIRKK